MQYDYVVFRNGMRSSSSRDFGTSYGNLIAGMPFDQQPDNMEYNTMRSIAMSGGQVSINGNTLVPMPIEEGAKSDSSLVQEYKKFFGSPVTWMCVGMLIYYWITK